MNLLLATDDSRWGHTLSHQLQLLSDSLPIHVNERSLEEEAIALDHEIEPPIAGLSLAARLMIVLKPLNLTFQCKAGHIEISANSGGVTRIYDVSPLVDGIRGGLEQLENTIMKTVEPDCWDIGGGTSTIAPHVANGSKVISTLVVVAPTPTHLQLQVLLDRLNQLGRGQSSSTETQKGSMLRFDNTRTDRTSRIDDRVIPRSSGF